jgi:flagellin
MALRIISALSSMRLPSQQLGAPSSLQRTYERLSTGQRVGNNPADVAISTSLRRDIRVATVALTNASMGVTLTNIADDALSEISALLGRMYELADKSASETILTNEERTLIQSEYTAIAGQIQSIAKDTSYNGINLLSGNSNIVLQVGLDGSSTSGLTLATAQGNLETLGLANSATGALTYSVNTQAASRSAQAMVQAAINEIENRRSVFTSMEDRLQVSIANLTSAREGLAAAEGGIREAAQFEATAEKTRSEIIKDAGAALLAQANQQPLTAAALLDVDSSRESKSKETSAIASTSASRLDSGAFQRDRDPSALIKLREELKKE